MQTSRAVPSMSPLKDPQKIRLRIVALSIFASIAIFCLKALAFRLTGSAALKSDAMEGVVNIVAACFALGALVFAGRPADRGHPYGHGKMENLSAIFEGGLVALASLFILYEGIMSLLHGAPLRALDTGLLLNFSAGCLNGILGWYLIRTGKQYDSQAITADGHHVLSDFYTTLGIVVGLLMVKWTGYRPLDGILAILVGLLLAWAGFRLVKRSAAQLLDSEDEGLIVKLVDTFNRVRPSDVITVHETRTMRAGRFTHIDLHIVVPEFYEVRKAHELVERFEDTVLDDLNLEGEFHSHIDPCLKRFCENCAVAPCPIRRHAFERALVITPEDAIAPGPQHYEHSRP